MQINDIMNIEVGGKDKHQAGPIDVSDYRDRIITEHSKRHDDESKIHKDNLGIIKGADLTYNNPNNNSILDDIENASDESGRISKASVMSQRNFDAIKELGFDSKDMDEKEFVDIADKIRIAMAKGGADISMMGDISDAAIRQSGAYSELMANELEKAQLPSDEKTVNDSVIALRKVDEIKSQMVKSTSQSNSENSLNYNTNSSSHLSEETIKYMLSNEMEPTIDNLYKASTYSNDTATTDTVNITGNTSSMEAQFAEIIKEAGIAVNEDSLKDCYWMIGNRISVTPEQLTNLNELRNLDIRDMNKVFNAIVSAVADGNMPDDAYLTPGHSNYANAKAIAVGIIEASDAIIEEVNDNDEPLTLNNIAKFALMHSNSGSAEADILELENASKLPVNNILENEITEGISYNSDITTKAVQPTQDISSTASQFAEITAKKELVQVQLMMSVEANFALVKRGISLDTMMLNEYVDAIEELERQFAETMLGNSATDSNVKLLDDSLDAVNVSKNLPDYAMPLNASSLTLRSYASISIEYSEVNMMTESSDDENAELSTNFSTKLNRARDYYEASGTEVRRDLGDSLKKAFRNVDNLLDEMGMETTEENRKAVRLLAYNQMEITEAAVKEAKATDLTVTRALDSLKPGVVTTMIKTGFNPLDMTMEELLKKSEEIMGEMDMTSEEEKFSDFLWRLEQENGITDEEREGFIGVFRLIHQVNESDGAAIGLLLNQGTEVTMRNLLMATRTLRHTDRDYTVDDSFGGIEGFNRDSLNIEQQIEFSIQSAGMKKAEDEITPYKLMQFSDENEYMSLTPEQLSSRLSDMDGNYDIISHEQELTNAYNNMRREEVLESYNADRRVIEYLEANDIPLTNSNINAITALMSDRNSMMSTLLQRGARRQVGLDRKGSYASEVGMDKADDSESLEDEIRDIIANLIHEYGEAVKTPEDMAEAEQRLEEMAENVMKNMIVEEDVRSIDVRGMHLIQTELKTLGKVQERTENYTVPIMVADEVGNLSLKIVRGKEEKGLVDIAFDMEKTGKVTASFRYEAGEFVGEVNCDRETTREMLERHSSELEQAVSHNSDSNINITFSWNKKIDVNEFVLTEPKTDFDTATREEYMDKNNETQTVLTKSLYGMARAFIEELGQL